jgi:hypothetical protein
MRYRVPTFWQYIYIKNNKLLESHKTAEKRVFLNFLPVAARIRIRTNNYGSGS